MNKIGRDCSNIIMTFFYKILFNDVLQELKTIYIYENNHLIYGKCDLCHNLTNIRKLNQYHNDIDDVCLICRSLLIKTPPYYKYCVC